MMASPVPTFSRELTESKRSKQVIPRRHCGELQVADSIAVPAAAEPFTPCSEAAFAAFAGFGKTRKFNYLSDHRERFYRRDFDINHIRDTLTIP
jgi:hypothetical protein